MENSGKNVSFIGKIPKNKISHIFLIHYENFMASIKSLFFHISHVFWSEKGHYRGHTMAKRGQFWKTLVKNASFIGKTLKKKISHIFIIHY